MTEAAVVPFPPKETVVHISSNDAAIAKYVADAMPMFDAPPPPTDLPVANPPVAAPAIIRARIQIAICGTTPSRGMAPINDPTWQIWTIGPGGKDAHRWERLFEVHHVWPDNFAEYLNDLSNVKPPQMVYTDRKSTRLNSSHRL